MNYFDIIGLYIRKNKWGNFFIDSVNILEDNDIVILLYYNIVKQTEQILTEFVNNRVL